MGKFPKVTKAEMLPGVRLRLEFENGQIRYYPVREQIQLLMKPADVTHLKETYGANLFLGGMMTWMGNEITIEPNGDVLLNKALIPAELLWKNSTRHLNGFRAGEKEELEALPHPYWQGVKSVSLILWIIGLFLVVVLLVELAVSLGFLKV
ncbi:hypothetical protein [Lactococcus taiwanensis]|uniref:hypothetical protein n=1 Tax=Lactococcus taiwanensis TaxID=1151742 RepID=UPI0023F40CF0|nr:hypothetical protein [Lactococcus taiwanensis]